MKTVTSLLMLCFFLNSCQHTPRNFEGGDSESRASLAMSPPPTVAKQVSDATEGQPALADRMLIKNGYLTIEVKDIPQTKGAIAIICKEHGAYSSSEMQNNYDTRMEYEQVIRVPAESFDVIVQKIESLGSDVDNKSIQTTDVTEEFIDNEARIKTKKELEARYREILKQAKVVSDILSIESQLNHVRSDIESMEGHLKFLKNQAAYSTLSLTFYKSIGTDFGFGSKIVSAAGNGWDMLLLFVIGLLNIWPFLLIGVGLLLITLRRIRIKKSVSEPI